jgi:hypothetical protein
MFGGWGGDALSHINRRGVVLPQARILFLVAWLGEGRRRETFRRWSRMRRRQAPSPHHDFHLPLRLPRRLHRDATSCPSAVKNSISRPTSELPARL